MSQSAKVLIVDDEELIRLNLRMLLEDLGYCVVEAADGREGLDAFNREGPDLILADLRMPVVDGLSMIAGLRQKSTETPVIVISGTGTVQNAVDSLRLGAWDYVIKPVEDAKAFEVVIERTLEKARLLKENRLYREHLEELVRERTEELRKAHDELKLRHQEVSRLKDMLADDNRYLYNELRSVSGAEIIGSDFGLKPVMEMVRQVAPLDSPVLLLGETGTGKEIIANAIHYSSPRKDGPFIKVNCGAIPESLLDSELFGHEKGAFTGAMSQKRGRFERANKGTIFLDEIGELPAQAQVRLLRVLQTKEIERVGGTTSIPVNVRIISATNRNLQEMIASGRFREDLWFRLNVFPISIPPLRQRREDIPALVHYFIDRKFKELKLTGRPVLAPGASDRLMAHEWPGNVRELENLIERCLIQHRGAGALSFETLLPILHPKDRDVAQDSGRNRDLVPLDEITARHIRQALKVAGGKINGPGGAAQILGLHPNTLRARMNRLGIPYGRKTWQPDSRG
jgi:DNA-binding NtrC family response regulator